MSENLRARIARADADLKKAFARNDDQGVDAAYDRYLKLLVEERRGEKQRDNEAWRRAEFARMASNPNAINPNAVEHGADEDLDADPLRDARDRTRHSRPWQLPGPLAQQGPGEVRSRALSAVEQTSGVSRATREHATRLIDEDPTSKVAAWALAASDPEYLSAFRSLMVDPDRGHLGWSPAQREAFDRAQTLTRAMSLTDTAGGYLVPFQLDPNVIITSDGVVDPVRQLARNVTATGDVWHGVSSAGVSAEWLAEAAEAADASPTFEQPTVPVHKASAFVPISFEAYQDEANVTGEVARLLADAKANHEAPAFITGSGTGQPTGLVTAVAADAGSVVAPTTAEAFALNDVFKLIEAVPPRYRAGAQWLAALPIINLIRRFAENNASSSVLADLGADSPPRLLGKSLNESSEMDDGFDPAVTANNYILLAGAFDQYVVADRIGMTVELIPNLMGANRRPTGQRGWFMWWRVGANVTDSNAFRVLNVATTA